MARDGVAILDLQGVEVGVLLERLVARALVALQLAPHLLKEVLLPVAGEGRRVTHQAVDHHLHLHLNVAVVRQLDDHVEKLQAVAAFHHASNAAHAQGVAVGQEVNLVIVLGPKIIVLDHHQQVAGTEQFLTIENTAADATVEERRAAVAARDHDGLLDAVTVIAVADCLEQELAADSLQVIARAHVKAWRGEFSPTLYGLAQQCGGAQDATLEGLARHLPQLHGI